MARTTPEHDEHAIQTGSLLLNPPVPEEDRAAFRTVVRCGRLLGRDGLLSVRNQLFANVPSEPFVEAGVTIHARACSPWLDRLFLKLYADQITLAHWIGALAANVHIRPIKPNVWSAAAALALRLEDVDSAHKFLVRFRTDETYGDVAELALLKLHLQRKDLSRTIALLVRSRDTGASALVLQLHLPSCLGGRGHVGLARMPLRWLTPATRFRGRCSCSLCAAEQAVPGTEEKGVRADHAQPCALQSRRQSGGNVGHQCYGAWNTPPTTHRPPPPPLS